MKTTKRKREALSGEEDGGSTNTTTSPTSTATAESSYGDPSNRAGDEVRGLDHPQPRLQQTAASKRRRTTVTSSSSTGPAAGSREEAMVRESVAADGVGRLLTKRRRRQDPTGIDDGGGGPHDQQFTSAEDLNGVDDIDVDRPRHPARPPQHDQQRDEADGAVTLQRPAKKVKASSAEAGLISPMRAFADAEAAAAAAAVANGPLGDFAVLPVEIMLHLLSFLSGKDVCHVRLTSSEFNRLGKDETLWKAICLREFAPIPNRLFQQPFGKTWEWLYRSKAVVHNTKDSIKDGAVCCYRTKECRYEGEWREKELDGYGIELWSDGEEYEGWSTHGRLNGYGRASYTSGDTYIGMWKNGLRDGGIYVWSDGWRYEGEYQDGKLTGRGTLLFKNGSKFTGYWLDGERHGEGTMMYFDGSRYEGEWKHDKREGRGILYWPTSSPATSSTTSGAPTSSCASPPTPSSFDSSSPRLPAPSVSSSSPSASSPKQKVKHMRYEGFWRDDQILEGGKVLWEDGAELSLEEALKRLR